MNPVSLTFSSRQIKGEIELIVFFPASKFAVLRNTPFLLPVLGLNFKCNRLFLLVTLWYFSLEILSDASKSPFLERNKGVESDVALQKKPSLLLELGCVRVGPDKNPGPAGTAQLGANAQRQWHRVNNSTRFCWTCHSQGHSCEERLGTIGGLFVLFDPYLGRLSLGPCGKVETMAKRLVGGRGGATGQHVLDALHWNDCLREAGR